MNMTQTFQNYLFNNAHWTPHIKCICLTNIDIILLVNEKQSCKTKNYFFLLNSIK